MKPRPNSLRNFGEELRKLADQLEMVSRKVLMLSRISLEMQLNISPELSKDSETSSEVSHESSLATWLALVKQSRRWLLRLPDLERDWSDTLVPDSEESWTSWEVLPGDMDQWSSEDSVQSPSRPCLPTLELISWDSQSSFHHLQICLNKVVSQRVAGLHHNTSQQLINSKLRLLRMRYKKSILVIWTLVPRNQRREQSRIGLLVNKPLLRRTNGTGEDDVPAKGRKNFMRSSWQAVSEWHHLLTCSINLSIVTINA